MFLSTAWELKNIKSQLESADEDVRTLAIRHAIGLYRERSGMQKIGEGYYGLESGEEILGIIYNAVDNGQVTAKDVVEWVTQERAAFAKAYQEVDAAFKRAMAIPASELNIVLAKRTNEPA